MASSGQTGDKWYQWSISGWRGGAPEGGMCCCVEAGGGRLTDAARRIIAVAAPRILAKRFDPWSNHWANTAVPTISAARSDTAAPAIPATAAAPHGSAASPRAAAPLPCGAVRKARGGLRRRGWYGGGLHGAERRGLGRSNV